MKARWIRLGPVEPLDFDAACGALAAAQQASSAPILLWGEGRCEYPFALVVPRRFLPGRRPRWMSWALASAVATYRQFAVPAYLEGGAVWLHGRRIASATLAETGECAVFASSYLLQFPAKCVATPSVELQEAFRLRLEAQHGWQFDHSWPKARESAGYAVA
jgi:hypothetical protein